MAVASVRRANGQVEKFVSIFGEREMGMTNDRLCRFLIAGTLSGTSEARNTPKSTTTGNWSVTPDVVFGVWINRNATRQ